MFRHNLLPRSQHLKHTPDKSGFITALRLLGKFLPGDYLKTAFYMNIIARPRTTIRRLINTFYRMDHIYAVLLEAKRNYSGQFSILEFGTAHGYSFTKILYATKYLRMEDRVMVHTFDSFEGLPPPTHPSDRDLTDGPWREGEYRGDYIELLQYCHRHYKNFHIHKGYFKDTLAEEDVSFLKTNLPILVWIDCDYYTSTLTAFEKILPFVPNGCVIYFDDYDVNYGSRFTGEAKMVHDINNGLLGEGIELVVDRNLSLDSNMVYRFVSHPPRIQYDRVRDQGPRQARRRTNDSPLP